MSPAQRIRACAAWKSAESESERAEGPGKLDLRRDMFSNPNFHADEPPLSPAQRIHKDITLKQVVFSNPDLHAADGAASEQEVPQL